MVKQLVREEDVWQAFQKGEEEACSFLFHTYYNDLYNYALKIASDEALAKDTIQELFITLWRSRERLGQVKSVKPYLMKSLRRNLMRSISKRKPRISKPFFVIQPDIVFSPEEVLIRYETSDMRKDIVLQRLNQLSKRQREVIYLRFYDELTYDEIAQVMGLNYQSVMNHLHKALISLRSNTALQKLIEVTLCIALSLL